MRGYELVAELRRGQPTLPVVLISGYSEPATAPADLALSDVQLLPKPLNMKLLRTTVHSLLSR
jgi:DNA-binding NtrC family response regulator